MAKNVDQPPKAAAKAPARMSKKDPLTREQLQAIDAWWRAANYLSAGQLYLLDNPLPRAPETAYRGTLGHLPGTELHLHPLKPGHRQV